MALSLAGWIVTVSAAAAFAVRKPKRIVEKRIVEKRIVEKRIVEKRILLRMVVSVKRS
jgi:hypothetical protein